LLLIVVLIFFAGCTKDTATTDVQIKVGGLFSLTGNWSSLGKTATEAINIAATDINQYMIQVGSAYRFSTVVYDTKMETSGAQSALETGLRSGIKYYIGPQSSAEVAAIKSFANDNQLLIVSPSSTASTLAIADDAIFRFCPGDAVEGGAMARSIYTAGKTRLITLSRDDDGNKGLQQSVGSSFTTLGGTVDAINPYATTTTDFSAILATLQAKLNQHIAAVGADKVGVYIASFDECKDLFRQAMSNPIFSTVHWYGGDGVVLSSVLLGDTQAARFAAASQFFAPSFGLPSQPHPQLSRITNAIKTKTGLEPDAYALAAYDAMWVIARTLVSFPRGVTNFSAFRTVFSQEASQYFGITGAMLLNAAGDRSTGSFDYWGIVQEGTNLTWKLVGKSL
jgi:branched-chain amino acid transport system substrate-binding protein